MKLEIKEPCHENWDNMKIGLISRHCEVCNKGVMDFTKMNRGEIITYMLSNPNESVCGRLNKDQFDFHHDDIPILIEAFRKQRPSNSFMILALVCLSLASCSEGSGNIKTPSPLGEVHVVDSNNDEDSTSNSTHDDNRQDSVQNDPLRLDVVTKGKIATLGEVVTPVSGGICVVEPPEIDPPLPKVDPPSDEKADQIHQFAEVMPEFNGGMDALFKFIQSNLNYPDYEKKNNISGNVYVRFVVEKDGSITQPEILRSVKDSKNMDKEVLRVISIMPKWIPAKHQEREVRAYMTLPFRFNLK